MPPDRPQPEGRSAVVFDLDGVLIESEGVWDAAKRRLVAETGAAWREDATHAMLGMSSGEWSSYMHDELGVGLAPKEIDARVVELVLEDYRRALPLLPGATAAVERLSERWPLGLASSSNREVIDEVLALAGIADRFAVTVSSEEVAKGKPAPDVYLAATGALGVRPNAAVAIEDSTNGVRAAAAAGLHVIAVPNREFPPSRDALELAERTLPSIEELTAETVLSTLGLRPVR